LVTARCPDEPTREFRGGYHDAADYDLFYAHLTGTANLITAYEYARPEFAHMEMNLPESGNGLPDLLNEAIWGLKFYADTQQPDGAVFAGRNNDEDYGRKEWQRDGAKKHGKIPAYGNFPPCSASASAFAATAAQLARALRPLRANLADKYLEQARRAYTWAAANTTEAYHRQGPSYGRIDWKKALAWAAAELFKTTGEASFNDAFKRLHREGAFTSNWKTRRWQPFFQWPYATCEQPGTDRELYAALRRAIVADADAAVKHLELHAYRLSVRRPQGGWGSIVGGPDSGLVSLRAYLLTGDARYRTAASLNADYQLGANPLSRTFVTGVGSAPPRHPELRPPLYNAEGVPVAGIPVFGPGGGPRSMAGAYPEVRPLWRCWRDDPVSAIHNEFDVRLVARNAIFQILLHGARIPVEPKSK